MSESLSALRSVISAAFSAASTTVMLKLPGFDYERFEISEGEPVYWRQEKIPSGRMVRFLVTGKSLIRPHYHDVAEVLRCEKGVLQYDLNGISHALLPGETWTAQPYAVHGASFETPGEALVWWTDLDADELAISFFQQ